MKILLLMMALTGVVISSAYADHAQVTISIMPDVESHCIENPCITPSEVSIDVGGEIIWSNDGVESITILGDDDDIINSGPLQSGQVYHVVFDEAGKYNFMLESKPWITGTITVVDHDAVEYGDPLGIQIGTETNSEGGVLVHIMTDGWRWAPENVDGEAKLGEGHAHIYVDGEKIGRAYGPYYYINPLEPGSHQVRVVLNHNDHRSITVNGFLAEATAVVHVAEHDHHEHDGEPIAGTAEMAVDAVIHQGANDVYSLQLLLTNFEFVGQSDHRISAGYVNVYVDGNYIARMYDYWYKMPTLDAGTHTITVALFTNNSPYYWNGEPIQDTITVHVDEHTESDHDH